MASSGLPAAAAIAFAREGADVALSYLADEGADAEEVRKVIEAEGRTCLMLPGDIKDESICLELVKKAVAGLGGLDILVNNAGKQTNQPDIDDITSEQFDHTLKTNLYAMFWITKAALKHMPAGASIINTASVQGFSPSKGLVLRPGETVDIPNGMGTVTFDSVSRFASLEIHHDPARDWVLVFAILLLAGLLASLFVPRRRVWIKVVGVEDGGLRVEYAGLARSDDPQLGQAVIDLADESAIESLELVVSRIKKALRYVGADRLIVAPDCGMKYLPRDRAFGKLKAMAEGAAIVRHELAG